MFSAAVGSSVVLLTLGLGAASSGCRGAALPKAKKVTTTTVPPAPGAPRFVTKCTFSHTLSDDPIVKPNQPGASHSHDFFGNVTTNAATTLTTLKKGGTTCVNPNDLSGYWVPSLTVNGVTVQPTYANVYYQSAGKPYQNVKTIPQRARSRRRERDGDDPAEPEDRRVELRGRRGRRRVDGAAPPTCP